MIPLVEPQFLGFISHRAQVEYPGMGHQTFEPVGPIARNPVHHISAVRTAQRAGIGGIELRIDFRHRRHSEF